MILPGTIESLAVASTIANVWLLMRADVRNFPVGVVAVVLYAWVFWESALYGNLVLQLAYYLPLQFVGWWVWLRTGPRREDDLPIRRLSRSQNAIWLAVTALAAVVLGWLLSRGASGHVPWLDSATTIASVVGQYLLTRKLFENWLYWIGADAVYAFWLFPSQALWLSAALYLLLLAMAVAGATRWLRAARSGAVHA